MNTVNNINSVADDTVAQYRALYAGIFSEAASTLGDENPDPRSIAIRLVQRRPELSSSTWRLYRAATVYAWSEQGTESHMEAIAILKNPDNYAPSPSDDESVNKSRTSAKRLKKLPSKDWTQLAGLLVEKTKSGAWQWAPLTLSWIRVGLLTGMRPQESCHAFFGSKDGRKTLEIRSAKSTNGRGNGEFRRLFLDRMSEHDVAAIASHLAFIQEYSNAGQYRAVYKSCVETLGRACKQLWPRRKVHPTLYSARHQFMADARGDGFSRPEIAAMVGHGSDETAANYYGARAAQTRRLFVDPDPELVATVKRQHQAFDPATFQKSTPENQ